jgi:hypothetical protein
MEQSNLITFSKTIKKVFSKKRLNKLGKRIGLSKRERKITPERLAISTISALACGKTETLADIQRHFNAIFSESVAYKPFHNQLAKKTFAEYMLAVTNLLLEEFVTEVLQFKEDSPFRRFDKILLQDGSSFALKDSLKKVFPGRFTKISPAAVELQVTLNLLNESPEQIELTPDVASERDSLPLPESLKNALLLADRGYPSTEYLYQVQAAGGHFLMRHQCAINPLIRKAHLPDGNRLPQFEDKQLKKIKLRFSKKKTTDLDIEYTVNGNAVLFRLLVTWNRKTKEYQYLITSLSRTDYSCEQIILCYKLRWQIELLFKEWKSYANLHSFNTGNEAIAEGLIWAAIAAATFKRYIAHMTQKLKHVQISTRKAAMCIHEIWPMILSALIQGIASILRSALQNAMNYLSRNAARSHPKRDRRSGRMQLGLQPVFAELKD